jgi:hypothetical protein
MNASAIDAIGRLSAEKLGHPAERKSVKTGIGYYVSVCRAIIGNPKKD